VKPGSQPFVQLGRCLVQVDAGNADLLKSQLFSPLPDLVNRYR
jgi:hypothetical protein